MDSAEPEDVATCDGTTVTMGGKPLVFGETIELMRSSEDLLSDTEALRTRLSEDGYLLLRNFFDRAQIFRARSEIIAHMLEAGDLASDEDSDAAIIGRENKATIFRHHVIQERFPSFLSVVNSRRIYDFFGKLLEGHTLSLDHKWLRAIGHGHHTNAHLDIVYMGKGTRELYTAWTPFGDIPLEMGPLAVCLGSHRNEKLRATYGKSDAHDELETGFFSDDPDDVSETLGTRWASAPFAMGDLVIFGMFFMHGSLDNRTNRYRLSSDTRYQLSVEPVDERHMGETPDVIPKKTNRISVEQARKEWGL
jgi:ectoine hydroxylase-related dioxygenase (phytanoyl-CoA dioxygenase family)